MWVYEKTKSVLSYLKGNDLESMGYLNHIQTEFDIKMLLS